MFSLKQLFDEQKPATQKQQQQTKKGVNKNQSTKKKLHCLLSLCFFCFV